MEYHKIETMFERDKDFKVNVNKLRNKVYGTIKTWRASEKLDGTNIRITLTKEGKMKVGGRTDNAQIPTGLIEFIYENVSVEKLKEIFWKFSKDNKDKEEEPVDVVLYGEGIGAGIQKSGGDYSQEKIFVMFDILIDGKWWLDYDAVMEIAGKLGIEHAPDLGEMTLEEIINKVKFGMFSAFAKDNDVEREAEGIVARPLEALFDKRMKRVIIKIKTEDFK